MATVILLKSIRPSKVVDGLLEKLMRMNMPVLNEPVEADISCVIGGYHENPTMLKGEKVLFFDVKGWMFNANPPYGWMAFEPILEEYYDEMINLSNMKDGDKARFIRDYVKKRQTDNS